MTSRLKHRLEIENVNLKSKHLNESFVQIGTPLPALSDTKKDTQEYLPLWKQEVRDEKGRKRFHGAFTGGYSAGYYNTVGSKEGWTPQQFKSSRSSRATHQQRTDDFMDDEDRMQMNEDRQLENTETFRTDQFAGTREALQDKNLSGALEALVPAKTSMGQTLLQKLGWRPGQGLGPRVTLRKLKIQEGKLGKARVGISEEEEVEEAGKHTYAPRDTRLLVFDAKDDREGLGFQKGIGMGRLPAKRATYGAGMGGEEDDDPYGAIPSALDSRHYAFDKGEEESDIIVMGGDRSLPDAGDSRSTSRPLGGSDRWHDNRPVLLGFVLDIRGVPADKWWAFPVIPSDWKPQPSRVWDAANTFSGLEVTRGAPGRPLTHEQRGAALGEETRVSAAKSVWEYMSGKDRERLQAFAAAAKNGAPPPLSLEAEPELAPEKATEILIPPLSPRTAASALHGFMPYADDPHKQERYRSYLVSQTHNTKHPNPQLLPSTNVDEVNQELQSFAQSARIFKPMSYAMSSRFTSGSSSLAATDMQQPKAGLHVLDPNKALQFTKGTTDVEVEKVLSPREQAAANGQFGQLTRVVKDFYPVKLVCRRFHVADPHPEGKPEGSGTSTPTTGSGFQTPAPISAWQSAFVHQAGTDKENEPDSDQEMEELADRAPRSITDVGMAEDANQGRDTLTYVKPSIDIFKAIFASDDEDDEDNDDGEDEAVSKVPAAPSKFATVSTTAPRDPFPVDEKPVDYTTFKPVFRRAADEAKKVDDDQVQRKKEKKEKKKRKGVLSFDVGDGEDEMAAPRDKPRKKTKTARKEVVEEEWVEKAPVAPGSEPEKLSHVAPAADTPQSGHSAPRFSRKSAADMW